MKDLGKVNTALLALAVVLLSAVCVLSSRIMRQKAVVAQAPPGSAGVWDADKQLDFAETLAAKGLKKEALEAFEDYFKIAKVSVIEAAKLLYRMGSMHMELLNYEKAAYYFYKSETADPNSGFRQELNEKLAQCLEGLGMPAPYADEAKSQGRQPGGAVLARVGGKDITDKEIEDAMAAMPDWAKQSFQQGEGRLEFVRQYATTQAFYEKAKRMGLEQDIEVRRGIMDITKQLLVRKLLETELSGKITASPADLKAYYEANKDKYKQEASVTASVIRLLEQKSAEDAARRLTVGADFAKMVQQLSQDEATKAKGGVIEGEIEKNGYIPGIGDSKEAAVLIFAKKEGEIAGPVKIKDAYYIFRIDKVNSHQEKPFDEVKDAVEYEYKNQQVRENMQALLKDIMQQEQVEIYTDRIIPQEPQPPAPQTEETAKEEK